MMRASWMFRLLMLTFVLVLVFPCAALADACALCGGETGSDSYLCTACLLDMLEGEDISGGLELDTPVVNENGTVTLTWTDSEQNAPYGVYYQLLEQAPVPFGWTAAEDVMETSCTLTQLVPGQSYILIVTDAEGNKAQVIHYAPTPGEDTQIGAKIRFKTMIRDDRRTFRTDYSAAEIMQDNGREHGLYLRLTYSILKYTRNYAFCVTVEAPNGFEDVIFSGNLELHFGRSQIPVWGFVPMDDYFSYLERYYGGVPTGEYLVTMHFDGNVVYSLPFTVKE